MNRKWLIGSIIIISLIIMIIFYKKQTNELIGPNSLTPSPTPTPKQYYFDQSTDLKKELDSINPQILDSDFEYE